MRTTGYLFLNTVSNICTFITLITVLFILYYVKEIYNLFIKCSSNICSFGSEEETNTNNTKKYINNKDFSGAKSSESMHRDAESDNSSSKIRKCSNPFKSLSFHPFKKSNLNIPQEIIEEEENLNSFSEPLQNGKYTIIPDNSNNENSEKFQSYMDNRFNKHYRNCS